MANIVYPANSLGHRPHLPFKLCFEGSMFGWRLHYEFKTAEEAINRGREIGRRGYMQFAVIREHWDIHDDEQTYLGAEEILQEKCVRDLG